MVRPVYGASGKRTLDPVANPCRCVSRHVPTPLYTEEHHIDPEGWGGPDVASNRMPLCPTGHTIVTRYLARWRKQGFPDNYAYPANRYLYNVAVDGWLRYKERLARAVASV